MIRNSKSPDEKKISTLVKTQSNFIIISLDSMQRDDFNKIIAYEVKTERCGPIWAY
jgi:hypothetical protein